MTWTKLTDYAITNGDHLISNQGRENEYKHGTHSISKAMVGGKPRYTLWRLGSPDQVMGFFDSSDEAKRNAESDQA